MNLLCCFEDNTANSMATSETSKTAGANLEPGALEICRKFDKDGNGYLTKDEIKQAVGKSLSSKEIDELLKQADTNHDGKVDYEEFFKRFFSK
jgi:calmodulin